MAVPTASASYILARQLGGNASLMAEILTLQTLCAMVTIPLLCGYFILP
jgi:malonate transporter and related proteins